jgi:hypothetical protein
MNDEQEQATDSAPIEDWVVCPKCLKEVPMHRAHYCVRVTITTPEYEVTPERLVELLHDARSKTKEANRRDFESSAELAAHVAAATAKERQARELAEGENARLKAKLHSVTLAVDGYVDGAPDCNAVSKLANQVSLIINPPAYP